MNVERSRLVRYETLVAMLEQIIRSDDEILRRLGNLERDVDDIDRTLRPFGDGTKSPRRR